MTVPLPEVRKLVSVVALASVVVLVVPRDHVVRVTVAVVVEEQLFAESRVLELRLPSQYHVRFERAVVVKVEPIGAVVSAVVFLELMKKSSILKKWAFFFCTWKWN